MRANRKQAEALFRLTGTRALPGSPRDRLNAHQLACLRLALNDSDDQRIIFHFVAVHLDSPLLEVWGGGGGTPYVGLSLSAGRLRLKGNL